MTDAAAIKAGDRVRVTFESVYHPVWPSAERIVLAEFEGMPWYIRPDEPTRKIVSVEVLPPPEPAFRPGDVVRDAGGRTYVKVAGYRGEDDRPYEWLENGIRGRGYHDANLRRPLTLLVRDGKAVQ